jgi:hypothetical protein
MTESEILAMSETEHTLAPYRDAEKSRQGIARRGVVDAATVYAANGTQPAAIFGAWVSGGN